MLSTNHHSQYHCIADWKMGQFDQLILMLPLVSTSALQCTETNINYHCNAMIALLIERWGCRRAIWPADPDATSDANECTETNSNFHCNAIIALVIERWGQNDQFMLPLMPTNATETKLWCQVRQVHWDQIQNTSSPTPDFAQHCTEEH